MVVFLFVACDLVVCVFFKLSSFNFFLFFKTFSFLFSSCDLSWPKENYSSSTKVSFIVNVFLTYFLETVNQMGIFVLQILLFSFTAGKEQIWSFLFTPNNSSNIFPTICWELAFCSVICVKRPFGHLWFGFSVWMVRKYSCTAKGVTGRVKKLQLFWLSSVVIFWCFVILLWNL